MILHLAFNFEYLYKGTESVYDFRRAIREGVQKMKSAINEGLLYQAKKFCEFFSIEEKYNIPAFVFSFRTGCHEMCSS